jgi:translation elongation factor EF-1alpha
MNLSSRGILKFAFTLALATVGLAPATTLAQSASGSKDQWIHVRVENKENTGETVRVNVPIEMAEKVLPAINKDNLHNGKVHIDSAHTEDVDLRALLDAIRTSKDGEYVSVQSKENDVRVAKSGGYLLIHVTDKSSHQSAESKTKDGKTAAAHQSKVEIKVPMKVVDALFSAGKDELDVVAALHALSANGDTELVSVKDSENTVRVWIDSKNIAD